MIVKKDFLLKLKDFGLNSYESKLWTAILSRRVSTAGELSDIANVPRSRSYDVLESLEKKGFIITKVGKPIKYIAVPPEEVLERMKKKIEEDQIHKKNLLEKMKETGVLNELTVLYDNGVKMVEPDDLSGYFRGRQNSYDHLELLLKNATESIRMMTTLDGLERKNKAFKKVFKKLNDRGVKIKITAPLDANGKKLAEEMGPVAEIKSIQDTRGRFCIIDDADVWFMAMNDKEVHPSYDFGVWIKTPFFASTLSKMFDTIWEGGK